MNSSLCIALLRGINVGGHHTIPMAELRALCTDIGWREVRTYIQSGNVVFAADGEPENHERELGAAIGRRFGLEVPVIVRTAATWASYAAANPYPSASRTEPNLVMLALCGAPPNEDAVDLLLHRAADGERITRVGDALWIHYAGRSKLSPAILDRAAGSTVTTRNWRTVLKLAEMVGIETQ